MTTLTSLETLPGSVQAVPAVRAASRAYAEAKAAREAAVDRAASLRAIVEPRRYDGAPPSTDLVAQFEARASLPAAELDEAHTLAAEVRARAQRDAVLEVERDRLRAEREPGRRAAIERMVTAAEAAQRAALEVQAYDDATAAALGVIAPPHPLPMVLTLAEPIARVRRTLAPPPPAPRAPALKFVGRTWVRSSGLRTAPGEIVPVSAMEATEVEQVVREGWAVEVGG